MNQAICVDFPLPVSPVMMQNYQVISYNLAYQVIPDKASNLFLKLKNRKFPPLLLNLLGLIVMGLHYLLPINYRIIIIMNLTSQQGFYKSRRQADISLDSLQRIQTAPYKGSTAIHQIQRRREFLKFLNSTLSQQNDQSQASNQKANQSLKNKTVQFPKKQQSQLPFLTIEDSMQLNRVPQRNLLNIQDESIKQQKTYSKKWTNQRHCSVTDYPSTQGGKRPSIASTQDNYDREGLQKDSLLARPYQASYSFFSSQMGKTQSSLPQKVDSKPLPLPQSSHCYNRTVLNKYEPSIFSEFSNQVEVSGYTQMKDFLQRKYIVDKRPKAVPKLSTYQQQHSDSTPAIDSKQPDIEETDENQEAQEGQEFQADDQERNDENEPKEENTCEFGETKGSSFPENLTSLIAHRRQQKRALSNPSKSELIKLNQQFEGTSQKMMDFRLNLLCTIAQKKLGLLKKQSQAEKMIGRFQSDMPEAENGLKLQKSSAVERMFNNSTQYDHVRSKITQNMDSSGSRLSFTQDDSINQMIRDICNENKDQKQPLAHSGNKANERLSPSISGYQIKYQEPIIEIPNKLRTHSLDNFKKQKQSKLSIGQIYIDDEQKTKKSTLKQFMKTYNQYINNILWQTSDSFLKMKRSQYLAKCKTHKHQKSDNVFKRLEQDQTHWKLQKQKNMQEYASKYKGLSPQRQLLLQRIPNQSENKCLRTLKEPQGFWDNGAKSGLIKKPLKSFQSGLKASTSIQIESDSPPVLDLTVINVTQQQL